MKINKYEEQRPITETPKTSEIDTRKIESLTRELENFRRKEKIEDIINKEVEMYFKEENEKKKMIMRKKDKEGEIVIDHEYTSMLDKIEENKEKRMGERKEMLREMLKETMAPEDIERKIKEVESTIHEKIVEKLEEMMRERQVQNLRKKNQELELENKRLREQAEIDSEIKIGKQSEITETKKMKTYSEVMDFLDVLEKDIKDYAEQVEKIKTEQDGVDKIIALQKVQDEIRYYMYYNIEIMKVDSYFLREKEIDTTSIDKEIKETEGKILDLKNTVYNLLREEK